MPSSLSIANEANNFLDIISPEKEIEEGRLEKLNEFKNAMILHGFNAPFSALLAMSKGEADTQAAEELQDQKKHAKLVRYIASLKKFTLSRVRVAIAAHRLAAGLADAGKPHLIRYLPLDGSYRKMLID
jgi:Zn-finger domain-containing protein